MSMKILEEFFTCPICIEILNNPITTVCGHNYCKSCINFNLKTCPICKKCANFSHLNVNFQLKNIIESFKNLDNNQLKTKFFPEIKEEEDKKNQVLRILVKNIFRQDFLCENYQCIEIVKKLMIRILTNDKQYLSGLIDYVNNRLKFETQKTKNLYKNDNEIETFHSDLLCLDCKSFLEKYILSKSSNNQVGFNKRDSYVSSFFTLNNHFTTIPKESKKKPRLRTDNKENESSNIQKMEYEVPIDKYFNNSSRGKILFFNAGEGNIENVFRVKRFRCELIDKLNKSSGDNFSDNNNSIKYNHHSSNENIKHSANYESTNQIPQNTHFNLGKINNNCRDNIARKIQFDCSEMDENLNIILKDFSNKDMLVYNQSQKSDYLRDSNTNNTFSSLISNAFNSENLNTNPHANVFHNQIQVGKGNRFNFDSVSPMFSQFAHFNSDTRFDQSLLLNCMINPNENKSPDHKFIQDDYATEYQIKRRKL